MEIIPGKSINRDVLEKYTPPAFLFNAHLETIYPALFRKVIFKAGLRERITTPDGDFLDLDWWKQGAGKLVIISHGLEGNSSRAYITGMARAFFQQGFDAMAWNYRGCSGEVNHQLRFYHSGATDDLDTVIRSAVTRYNEIYLIGFSLGGNLTLKYLGEKGTSLLPQIRKAVTFSVPMDLYTSCLRISEPGNKIYSQRFLKSLRKKVIEKSRMMPGLKTDGIFDIPDLMTFDDFYTAPLHGFQNARHYYEQCSAVRFIEQIAIPTLVVNAQNDPFLSAQCSPVSLLAHHPQVILETPARGGHVGFSLFGENGLYWSEKRALAFVQG